MNNLIKSYVSDQKNSSLSFLVMAGAMQVKYDQFHPLVHLLLEYGKVFSLQLPGHGNDSDFLRNTEKINLESAIKVIYENIDDYCPKQNLIIIAYSISSLMTIKLIEILFKRNPDLKLIFIGSSLRIREESSKLIRMFFNVSTYKKFGWEKMMEKQHGKIWTKTVKLIDDMLLPDSGIEATDEEIQFILNKKDNFEFIIGEKDQPFNASDVLDFGPFNVTKVSGDHFNYFLKNKTWPEVEQSILNSFTKWGIIRK